VNGDEIKQASNQLIGAGCALMILAPVFIIAIMAIFALIGWIFS
jgi:hypothetical protein